MVSGYNNLQINGQSTSSYAVSGLSAGTNYYYRIRAESAYSVGTITSCNSNVINLTTTGGSSNSSDIIRNTGFTEPSNIDYTSYQENDLTSSSLEVARFDIRDGGGSADADALSTTLTAVTFSLSNWANVRKVAIYDGSTELSEVAVSSGTVTFSGLSGLSAPDDGTKTFNLRASFNSTVTDNQQFQFTITSATADGAGSTFATANAGGAQSSASGDANRIEVTATTLVCTNEPTLVTQNTDFSLTVSARDGYNQIDLDFTDQVELLKGNGTGTLSSATGLTQSLSAGAFTWNDLRWDTKENNVTIRTTNFSELMNDTTAPFDVILRTIIFTETMGTVSGTTTIAAHETADGFDNDQYTMTQGGATNPADIRTTNPSSGYAGASGSANVWFTSTSGVYGFAIEGIDASTYNYLTIQFGYRKEDASNLPSLALDYWNGSSYINVPFTFNEAPNAPTGWYLSPVIDLPGGAQINNLRLRWVKSGTIAVRIDDIVLKGNSTKTGTSDILSNGNEPSNIPYASYQNSAINATSDGIKVWSFTIRDGGGSADPDLTGTTLSAISIGKGNFNTVSSWAGTLRRAALFDGTTRIADIMVSSEMITFSGLSGSSVTAPDNGSKTLDLYVTFESTVTDNQQFQFKVTSASADGSGSVFAVADAGGATSSVFGDRNQIEVTADRLTFFNEPTVAYQNDEFDLTVSATDGFGNIDADATSSVTLSKNAGTGTLSSSTGLTQSLVSGTYTWYDLLWDTIEDNVRIASSNTGGLVNDTTASFNVIALNLYTWNQTGSASYTVAANWTPTRSAPDTTDVLLFNSGATVTVTNVPTQTIGKLIVTNNTTVNLQAGTNGNTLTLNGLGSYDLKVNSGSQLNINGSNILNIVLNTGATASIYGDMTFSNAAHRLNAVTTGAMRFRNGSSLTQSSGFTGNIFTNSGTANIAVFETGSKIINQAGANPFGLSAPNSKVTFQTGSYYIHQQSGALSFSGRTYANVVIDYPSFYQYATGGSMLTLDSLIISQGSLALNLTGGVNYNGSVNIQSGCILRMDTTMNVSFVGNVEQKIYGAGTLAFGTNANVIVNKNDTLRFLKNITINQTLTLTKGIIHISGGNVLTLSAPATLSGGSNTSYVEGALAKIFPVSASPQSFQFKTGSRGDIQPVTVNLATVSGSPVTITSQQINGNPLIDLPTTAINTATIDNISGVHYWNITQSGGSFTNAQITLTYISTPGNSDSVQLGSELRLAQLDNSNIWQLIGGAGSANWSGTITSNVFNDFQGGYFTFADPVGGADITLPVELAYFRVERSEKTGWVHLSWRTESEINNAFFLVQRRYATGDFGTLAEIPGQGNKSSRTDYTFTDSAAAISDTLYYRLADISYDGIKVYHPEKMIAPSQPQSFLLQPNYPNPFNPQTTLIYGLSAADHVSIEVYNVLGQKVRTLLRLKEQSAGWYRVIWDGTNDQGSRVAAGLYFSVFRTSKGRQVQKMLLIK